MKKIANLLLNENIILSLIIFNTIIIFIQQSGVSSPLLLYIDFVISFIFLMEMIVKLKEYGFSGYWKNAWNRLDGILVIITLPSMVELFIPLGINTYFVLTLRALRIFKSFRIIRFFPHVNELSKGLKKAIKDSYSVFTGLMIIILVFSLLNCSLFSRAAPEYFATPIDSIYSVFRLFTIEGWYAIPDKISEYYGNLPIIGIVVKFYFSILLIIGGIIGVSFVNSVFVDAMVSDNNDNLEEDIKRLERKINQLTDKIDKLQSK